MIGADGSRKSGVKPIYLAPHHLPSNLEPWMTDFEHEVVADFLVCPYQKDRPGEMRMVCGAPTQETQLARPRGPSCTR